MKSVFVLLIFFTGYSALAENTVNPILGDISFIQKYKVAPTEKTDSELRIRTHLEYVEQLLRAADISRLTAVQQKKRDHALDLLHAYWKRGIFPRNYVYADTRKPCFIDPDGRICAVGFLVEQTAGRKVAEVINQKFQYENLLDMEDVVLDNWIETYGFTKTECAMIQPTYGFWQYTPPDPEPLPYVNPDYSSGATPAVYLYVTDTRKEKKMQQQIDSQLVIIETLTLESDSLNNRLAASEKTTDSLATKNIQQQEDISALNQKSDHQAKLIWITSAAALVLVIAGLIGWIKFMKLRGNISI